MQKCYYLSCRLFSRNLGVEPRWKEIQDYFDRNCTVPATTALFYDSSRKDATHP